MDPLAFLHTRDPVERIALIAVGERVAEWRERNDTVERKNLSIEVGNVVGQHLNRALQAIAAAMRSG